MLGVKRDRETESYSDPTAPAPTATSSARPCRVGNRSYSGSKDAAAPRKNQDNGHQALCSTDGKEFWFVNLSEGKDGWTARKKSKLHQKNFIKGREKNVILFTASSVLYIYIK